MGRALVARAREVVRAYDGLLPSVLGEESVTGEISLGAVPTTLTALAPLAMSLLKKQFADLRVRVNPGLSTQMISEVERGALDAALISRPDALPPDIEFRQIAEEPIQLLASMETESDDPFELIEHHPFIRFNRNAVVGHTIETWLQKKGLRVRESMELDGLEAISSMVFANLGVSIAPARCVQAHNPLPLKRLSLGPDAPVRRLGLAFRKDTPRTRIIGELHETFLRAVKIGAFRPSVTNAGAG